MGGHPDPKVKEGGGGGGGAQSPKKNFLALWASVWSKNKGGPGPRVMDVDCFFDIHYYYHYFIKAMTVP